MSACICAAVASVASAQTFPTKPVRMVIGFPAGGPIDIMGRVVGQELGDRLCLTAGSASNNTRKNRQNQQNFN